MTKFIFLFFVLFFFLASQAFAHPPYLIKEAVIKDLIGNELILEKLYGDGVIASDPMKVQLRYKNGAVIARTKTYSSVTSFCPSVKFCWVFPHTQLLPLSIGFKLDYHKIISDIPQPELKFEDEGEETQFKNYLSDNNIKRTSSYAFGYPELDNSDYRFSKKTWSLLLSPFAIVAKHFYMLTIIFIISAIAASNLVTLKKHVHSSNKIICPLLGLIKFILFILVTGIAFGTFFLFFINSTNILYMFIAAILGKKFSKNIMQKWINKLHASQMQS